MTAPTHELGLFRDQKRHRPRDKAGRFTRVEYSPERRLIRKTTRELRERLGLPPRPALARELEK